MAAAWDLDSLSYLHPADFAGRLKNNWIYVLSETKALTSADKLCEILFAGGRVPFAGVSGSA